MGSFDEETVTQCRHTISTGTRLPVSSQSLASFRDLHQFSDKHPRDSTQMSLEGESGDAILLQVAVVRQEASGKGGVLGASPRVHLGILNPGCRKLRALCWRFSTSIAFPKLKVFPTCSFSGFLVKLDTNAAVSHSCPSAWWSGLYLENIPPASCVSSPFTE